MSFVVHEITSIMPLTMGYDENPYVLRLIHGFREAGINVSVVWRPISYIPNYLLWIVRSKLRWQLRKQVIQQGEQAVEGFIVRPIPYISIGRWSGIFALTCYLSMRKRSRFVEVSDATVIHAHYLFPDGALAYFLNKRTGIPYVLILQNEIRFVHNSVARYLSRRIINQAAGAMTHSVVMQESIASNIGKHIEVVPVGVRAEFYRDQQGSLGVIRRYLSVGRLIPVKNLENQIRAFVRVNEKFSKSLLYDIVGEGAERAHLERVIRECGASDSVRLLGERANRALPDLFRDYDAFLQVSNKETFGLASCEAMASGMPVIISQNSGVWLYKNSSSVLLAAKNGSVEEISDLMVLLYDKKFDVKELINAQKRIVAEMRHDIIVNRHIQALKNASINKSIIQNTAVRTFEQ